MAWREIEPEDFDVMHAAGVAAVQEEFDDRGLGTADLIVRVILDEALAAVARKAENG